MLDPNPKNRPTAEEIVESASTKCQPEKKNQEKPDECVVSWDVTKIATFRTTFLWVFLIL